MPWALMHPHTITEASFALFVGNSLDGVFHLWHIESDIHFSWKESWNIWPDNTFRLSFGPSQKTSGPKNMAAFLSKSSKCLPLCIIQFQVSSSWCSGKLCWVTRIFQSTPEPMWLCSIMVAWRFLKQYRLRARWSRAFSSGFHPWPLHKISPDSLNLFTILWTVDGEKPKLFAILHWETLSLNWLTILSQVWHKVVNHDPSLLAKTKPLVDAPFILNLDNLTCYQLNC